MPLPRPTTLVLSSGGLRGVAHVGALRAFARAGWLAPPPRTLVGTSAGGLVCALLALGYTPAELERLARDVDLAGLLGRGRGPGAITLRDLFANLPTRFGAIDSDTARVGDVVRTLVARSRVGAGDADLTLGELRRRTGRTLVLCATDLWTARAAYFGPDTTPGVGVAWAVRASAGIPLVFTPLDGRYVDGALTDHYPFARSPDDAARTVGVLILDDDDAEARGAPPPWSAPPVAPGFKGYARRLVRAVETSRARALLADPDLRERTVVVRCPRGGGGGGGGAADDAATDPPPGSGGGEERIDALLGCGERAADAFVAGLRARGVLARVSHGARARLGACLLRAKLLSEPSN